MRLGILGGGQLGRMLAVEARRLGHGVAILDPDPACSARPYADAFVQGALDDAAAALELARQSDVLTLETEHVPADVLDQVAKERPLHPRADVFRTVQDRLAQKTFLEAHRFPTAPFAPVASEAELRTALEEVGTPAVLKRRRGGYDGRGQAVVRRPAQALQAWARLGGAPCILEAFMVFRAEVSVVLARGAGGDLAAYPLLENVHRRGILHTTRVPAAAPKAVHRRAVKLAAGIAEALDHRGVLAVEMFLLPGGRLAVNELAPRVHNSGHVTLGACATSQFEQHVRAVLGLPLGDAALLRPGAMLNLLGDLWARGEPDWAPVLATPGAALHLYGKQPRPGRKMGHVTLLDRRGAAHALRTAERLHAKLARAAAQRPVGGAGAPSRRGSAA